MKDLRSAMKQCNKLIENTIEEAWAHFCLLKMMLNQALKQVSDDYEEKNEIIKFVPNLF